MKDEYIGRNALLSIITTKFNEHYGNTRYQFIHDFYRFVIRKICAAPAADVAEVRYGRVVVHEGREDEYYEYCSECKTMDIHSGDNFCPNCGCKLVGVKHSKHKE